MKAEPRVAGALVGDIFREPSARTKYSQLFECIGRRFPLVDVYDATLRGAARFLNAALMAHPNRRRWRERFYQNVPAFRARSKNTAAHFRKLQDSVDIVLQLGVLFDARWNEGPIPNVIYTDYTMRLSAQKPAAGRSPLTPGQLAQWITLERQAFERAAHICTRSRFVRESIIRDYGIAPDRVTAIGGGVNFSTLPALRPRPADAPPTLLFIGKEFYRKGGDLLLSAFAEVRQRVPQARLLLVTADPIPAHLPIAGVEVIKPTWNRAVIETLYQQADIFVLPSRLETWGDVLLEAMAYGLPCIGVTGEAMEEIVKHEVTGLLARSNDCESLAAAMERLLRDEQLRQQYGLAGRRLVETEFTWNHVVDRLAVILEAVHLQHKARVDVQPRPALSGRSVE